jgi:hypothetical protein
MHDKNKPFVKSGKLLNETGIIELNRITDETRQKVKEDTTRVDNDNTRFLKKSKIRVEKEERERLKATIQSRQAMTDKWVNMTKTSPYHNNLVAIEERRRSQMEKKENIKEIDRLKQATLDKMTGLPSFEVCPKDKIYQNDFNFDNISQVALEYRLQARAQKVIRHEKAFVDGMIMGEISTLHEKFPTILKREENQLYPTVIPMIKK